MDGFDTATKIDLRFAEDKIIFTICDCSLDKKYSFYSLNKLQATDFLDTLRYIEKYQWKQFAALDRKNGITCEKKGTVSFEMIDSQNTSETKFAEQHYFHFRVNKNDVFRVFGYQKDRFFCITHIDPDGRIHGHK